MKDIKQEIVAIKNSLDILNSKVDMVIDILNNFTIMLAEAGDAELEEEYGDEWYAEEEDYGNQWNSKEDES